MAKKGRKSKWDSHVLPYLDKVKKMSEVGYTEEKMCKYLGVGKDAFIRYKKEKPELQEALKKGRQEITLELRGALIKSAIGFQYEEKKSYKKRDESGNEVMHIEVTQKTALPNTASLSLALKNYDKSDWANDPQLLELKKREVELKEKKINAEVAILEMNIDEMKRAIEENDTTKAMKLLKIFEKNSGINADE